MPDKEIYVRPAALWCVALTGMVVFAMPHLGWADQAHPPECDYDRVAMLALEQQAFDQDMPGGWRALADRPGCSSAAADLLRDYRQAHAITGGIVIWHEDQLRAEAGQSAQAIALFEKSYKPASEDLAGWNPYVDAMIAFMKRDRTGLEAARTRLAAVPYPQGNDMPPLQDGYMILPAVPGRPEIKAKWPPNLDVVDGLLRCFDDTYSNAYGAARCRHSTSTLSK